LVALTRMHARSMAWICLRAYQCHTCLNRSGSSCKCAGRSCARWLGDNASRYSKCFNLHACPSSKGNVELVGALRTISAKCGWTQPGAFTWTASRPSGLSYSAPRARPPPAPRPPTGVAQQVARRAPAAGARDAECGMQLQRLPHHPLVLGGGGRGRLGACCYCLTCFESC
jgi:hypothetical protein